MVLPPPRIALVTPRSGAAVGSAVADLQLTVKQLKEKLKDAGLPVSGKKAELIERLGAGGAAPPAPADDLLLAVDEAAVEVEEAAVEDDAAALEGLSPPPQFEPAPAAAEAGAVDVDAMYDELLQDLDGDGDLEALLIEEEAAADEEAPASGALPPLDDLLEADADADADAPLGGSGAPPLPDWGAASPLADLIDADLDDLGAPIGGGGFGGAAAAAGGAPQDPAAGAPNPEEDQWLEELLSGGAARDGGGGGGGGGAHGRARTAEARGRRRTTGAARPRSTARPTSPARARCAARSCARSSRRSTQRCSR